MAKKQPDGATQREHLEAAERATGKLIPELHPDPLPAGCQQVWHTFLELHNARGSTGMGVAAIGWRDLAAWQDVCGVRLTHWEIDCITAMDQVALKTINESK